MSKLILRKDISVPDLDLLVQNKHLGLPAHFNDREIYNILMDTGHKMMFREDPMMEILDIMSNPDYFYFTCKWLFGIELMPFQVLVLQDLWTRKFPMLVASRGFGKTFLLAIYAMLRAIFHQGCKIVVVGAAFRQSKLIFGYMETIWRNSPVLRNMVGAGKSQGPKRDIDRCTFYIGDSEVVALPVGDGSNIRGMRSNYTLVDEFSSLALEVFEVVIKGFGAVSSSPTKRAENFARIKVLKSLGMYAEADDVDLGFGNQIVISGTAYYHFNHFYDYWLRYKQIIESKGEIKKLEEIFHGEVPPNFDWKHYSIFRIPWTKLPPGFMDESLIGQTKATAHSTVYSMEFGATWSRDSDGFFKRSLIERCVCKEPIQLESGPVHFSAMTSGKPNCEYVYGIDPASEQDSFSIVILERHKDHRRIVYSWSIDRQKMRERITAKGRTSQKSFYAYCARKIRDLMKVFPTQHIGVDTQGGGIALMEALHDPSEYEPNIERPLWPWVRQGDKDVFWWEKPDKPTDGEPGLHILHMVQFANADFMRDSNHGLRKDFESRIVIFPFFDTATIGEAISLDKLYNRQFDTMEDCVMEIEELKDELATIIHTQSAGGRDRWDTPEVKLPGNKKGHLRKDRYSALIIANMVARVMDNQLQGIQYSPAGAYVGQKKIGRNGPMYVGPQQYITKMGATGRCLKR